LSFPNFLLDEAVLYGSQQWIGGKMLFSDTCQTEIAIESDLVKQKIWETQGRGKRKRKDVQLFERYLEDNIFQLRDDLISFQYQHDQYEHFYVSDPKQRHISKATVRDRLVHQMVYAVLTDVFDKTLFFHSLSNRSGKGTIYSNINLLVIEIITHPP
jgi:retron-type reverse transcriptase